MIPATINPYGVSLAVMTRLCFSISIVCPFLVIAYQFSPSSMHLLVVTAIWEDSIRAEIPTLCMYARDPFHVCGSWIKGSKVSMMVKDKWISDQAVAGKWKDVGFRKYARATHYWPQSTYLINKDAANERTLFQYMYWLTTIADIWYLVPKSKPVSTLWIATGHSDVLTTGRPPPHGIW